MIKCHAFGSVPPFAQGLVRDLRVRWALEETDLPYRVMLVGDRPDETQRWAQERRPAAVEAVRTDLLEEQPRLVAYKERCEAQPGFTEALAEQMMAFAA